MLVLSHSDKLTTSMGIWNGAGVTKTWFLLLKLPCLRLFFLLIFISRVVGEFAPHPLTHQDQISCVSNSCLTLISELFPYHLHENSDCLKTALDQGKRLRLTRRVQSGSRGTRTILYTPVSCGTGLSFRGTRTFPYAYWRGECQCERAPVLGENALWSCVSDRIDRDVAGIERRNQGMTEFEGGRRPTKGRSGVKERWSGKITKSQSKSGELSVQSV